MSEHNKAVVVVSGKLYSWCDVPNDAWVCTTRYEWTSSISKGYKVVCSCEDFVWESRVDICLHSQSIIEVLDMMWINGSNDWKMTNE